MARRPEIFRQDREVRSLVVCARLIKTIASRSREPSSRNSQLSFNVVCVFLIPYFSNCPYQALVPVNFVLSANDSANVEKCTSNAHHKFKNTFQICPKCEVHRCKYWRAVRYMLYDSSLSTFRRIRENDFLSSGLQQAASRLKMGNKVSSYIRQCWCTSNSPADESHALLVRGGYFRQVIVPIPAPSSSLIT
jgi:hypothetical protein